MKVLALPEIQETSDLPCDTGSDVELLEKEFGEKVYLSLVKEGWNNKKGKWSPASHCIEARAREARVFIRELAVRAAEESGNDVHIAVVTHGGFLHYFTEDWDGAGTFTGTGWENTEVRGYEFVDLEGSDEGASFRELGESREGRKGGERVLSGDEQRELKASAEREWVESGFQVEASKL